MLYNNNLIWKFITKENFKFSLIALAAKFFLNL